MHIEKVIEKSSFTCTRILSLPKCKNYTCCIFNFIINYEPNLIFFFNLAFYEAVNVFEISDLASSFFVSWDFVLLR